MLARFLILLFLSLAFSTTYAVDLSKVSNKPAKGTVALTFDDGPTVEYTPQILAILKKYNIKATFFMVGENAKAHPEIVKMVLADGHAIDSHSMTHPMLTKLSNAKLEWEVHEPSVIINDIVGIKPVCLRYPFGASMSTCVMLFAQIICYLRQWDGIHLIMTAQAPIKLLITY
jgi:peptidoglycan/xylan/chitin deacetylase (PgdA/CDA1 family)